MGTGFPILDTRFSILDDNGAVVSDIHRASRIQHRVSFIQYSELCSKYRDSSHNSTMALIAPLISGYLNEKP